VDGETMVANARMSKQANDDGIGGVSVYAALGGSGNALLTNSVVVAKASPGNLFAFDVDASGATLDLFIQFFDAATGGAVSLGTTPAKMSYRVPAGALERFNMFPDTGQNFTVGIALACTGNRNDSTAPNVQPAAHIYFK
jgi:hypothetical protein